MADENAITKTKPAKTQPAAQAGEKCCAEKCKQPVRAKGYCRKHYMAWRRGKIGNELQCFSRLKLQRTGGKG